MEKLVSIVIPVLNEEPFLSQVLSCIAADASAPFEILVADGGSTDATREIAARYDARIIDAEPGRGIQLDAGASAASGDIIWFLHADTRFAPGALSAIRRSVSDQEWEGGNFRVTFDGEDGFSRWLTGFYAWFRRHGLYYGDSGIFVSRDLYDRIGGIRAIALMEDYDLTRRMERAGRTCCIETPGLTTSSRKFRHRHPVSIVFGWIRLHMLYAAGVSPARLAKIYYRR